MIKGEKIYLEAIERDDLLQLKEWRNLPEIKMNCREYREINTSMQEIWYESRVLNDPSTIMFSIKNIESQELLGSCGLCYINWVHRHAEIYLIIGWNGSYIDDCGYAQESSKLLLDYGFNELGLNKIWVEVFDFDNKKKRFFTEAGFKIDGTLRDHHYFEGLWYNSIIFSLLSKEWVSNSLV